MSRISGEEKKISEIKFLSNQGFDKIKNINQQTTFGTKNMIHKNKKTSKQQIIKKFFLLNVLLNYVINVNLWT